MYVKDWAAELIVWMILLNFVLHLHERVHEIHIAAAQMVMAITMSLLTSQFAQLHQDR